MEGIKGKVSWLNPGVLEGAARTLIKWLAAGGAAGGSPGSRRGSVCSAARGCSPRGGGCQRCRGVPSPVCAPGPGRWPPG